MLDVLNSAVKSVEMSETTTVDWLSWDEDIKMIIEFNSMICLFVEDSIDLKINRFVNALFEILTKNDSSRFFFIQMTDETR
jgi:hypothetical protein